MTTDEKGKTIIDETLFNSITKVLEDKISHLENKIDSFENNNTDNIYGNIIVSNKIVLLEETETNGFTVRLDKQPTREQVVELVVDNENCSIDRNTLIFEPYNYDVPQAVFIKAEHDYLTYEHETSIITLSSENVNDRTINVFIRNIDVKIDGGDITPPEPPTEEKINIFPPFTQWTKQSNVQIGQLGDYDIDFTSNNIGFGVAIYDIKNFTCNDNITIGFDALRNVKIKIIDSLNQNCFVFDNNKQESTQKIFGIPPFSMIIESLGEGKSYVRGAYIYKEKDGTNIEEEKKDSILPIMSQWNVQNGVTVRSCTKNSVSFKTNSVGLGLSVYDVDFLKNDDIIELGYSRCENVNVKIIDSEYKVCCRLTKDLNKVSTVLQGKEPFSIIVESTSSGTCTISNLYLKRQEDNHAVELYGNIIVDNTEINMQEGTTARISIKLDNKPTNNQQVDILCYNDDIESNVDKIIFTPNNYNIYQTFIITAKHDKNSYDNKTSKITLKSKNVLDKNINVNIKNVDMKYGNIVVDTSDIEIEEGKEVNIAISLDSKPSENQTINLRTSNDNINLSSNILSISPDKYNFPHLITVSAPHKDDYFKNLNSTIIISSDNTPNKYIHVKILNIDEKRGNIILDKNNISFNKNEYVTFTVKLDEQPTSNQKVLINVDNDNVNMSVNSLTFTPQDYNKGQTVSVTASVSGTATITLSSNGVPSKTILLNIKEEITEPDNNLIIIPKSDNFTVNESTSYQLSYTIQGNIPYGRQKEIEISCSDSNVIVNPSHVIVNSTNINNVFYTTLNLLQTSLESGRNAKLIFSGDGIVTKEVNFTINNNNSGEEGSVYGEIILDKTSVVITDNEIVTIGVKLDKSPTNTQLININANNNYIQLNKTGISFNSSNYNTYQYVTVGKYPTLDNTQGLNFSSIITFSSSNVQDATVNVTVNLSETVVTPEEKFGQIIISNNNISLKEGETSTFTVKLDIQPTNNQIINIETLDSSIVNVSVSSLVFTPNNYNVPQTVTVKGIKDTASYADKTTRIILSSNNVTTQYAYVTVINTDTAPGGSGDTEDNDTYLTLEDNKVRNLVPYLSTYYIKPTVSPNEDIKFDYFVTDYYGRSYTNNSNFYTYKIIVKRQGKSDMIIRNISAGDHSLNLGSYSQEGIYHFSIVAVDQYGRYSHELFNYVRVQNSKSLNTYNITSSDLASYNIKTNLDKEEREYVPVSGANFEKIENDTQKATVQSAIDNAYNNGSASSGKYKVFIPMFGASNGTNYKGKTNGWKCLKVKYGSGFDSTAFLNECTLNRSNLQKLIDDKAKLGYTKIVLPNATYMIDNNPIDIPDGVTLDLGGATIKMCPITGNGALMMRMTDCTDTHLCNGTIEGDYFAHDYANSTSNSEWVSGVEMGGSCRYCSIRDLTIKNITGYGLQNSISSTSPNGNTFYGAIKVGNLTQGDIDRKTGQDINCSYRLRSGSVNISAYQGNSDFISMSIHLNYQGNEFSSWNYFMYFYDSANKFIKAISAYQYRQVKIPQNAYYVRVVILGERLKSNWNLHYQFFRVPTHCEFRNVTIDNARCVGMAQGQMKDFLVQDCTITNSGQSSATCSYDAEDGWDGMQDAFFENFRIYDCPNNGFLCCAGHNFCVNNMQSDAIYMWERIRWALIKNSTFDKGCVIRGGGEANIVQHGVTRFINNTVSAPDYTNYLFMNVAKNCTYNVAPKNGILINCIINGNNVSRVVYNNDTNNSIVDDIGTLTDNVDYGSTEGGGSEGGGSGDTGNPTVNVTGVYLNMSTVTLNVGSTQQLIASIQPANATNQNVTWSTTSSSIATVSSTGLVTAISAGTVTITVTTYDGNYRATCNIIVSQPTTPPSSGGGSGSSGETEFVDGLAVVKYPATPKTNPKYWAALGDSITAGTGAGGSSYAYCAVAGKSIGCQVANYGIPGSCVNDGYNTALTEPGYDQAFVNRYDEMGTGYDLVTVLGSVNDHRADSKIGKEGSTDSRDFYGALYVLINGLKQRYPNARIVFITPFKTADWNGTNLYGHTMQDFRNAIVVMCNKYQIEVLDLFTVKQFEWLKGLLNSPSYFYQYDYYHPTPAGHIAIGNYLVEHMFNGTSSGSSGGTSGGSGGSSSGGSNQGTTTTVYGNIISSSNTLTLAQNSSTTISITLDKQPTYNQNVYISTSGNIYTSTTTLEFTPSNYNTSHVFTVYANSAGSATITLTSSNVSSVTINVTINAQSSSGGSSGGSTSSGITNSNETALTQQYSSSHEATPNIANPPTGGYNWKYAPRINPDGSFPNSTWNAFGHWMTTYKVEGASYYDNVGLLLQDPKAWIWNSQTNSWDVLSSDFEWGSWYLEDFYDDGNSTISNSVTWENGVSGNHSTWVKIKQDSTTNGRCFHPWGYQKNWRNNPAWSNNGQPYIVTKIDFKLVKYNESGADNLSNAQLVVNSGGDWWSEVGATWKPDWSTNRDMCVGKYIKATRELKRAWATNLPSSWSHGLPTDGNSSSGGSGSTGGGSTGGGSTGGSSSSNHNFAKLLQYSLYFYDANMCGTLPSTNLVNWRGNCHTGDTFTYQGVTYDAHGGYHDAGDHVKFGQPMAYSMAVLGLSYYEFPEVYSELKQKGHLKNITDYAMEYFKRCTVWTDSSKTSVKAFCYQICDGTVDHAQWSTPESQTGMQSTRNSFSLIADSSNPATNVISETVSALALNYINFGNADDYKYAKALYEFARNNTKRAANQVGDFYVTDLWAPNYSFASAMMHIANNKAANNGIDTVNSIYSSEYNTYITHDTVGCYDGLSWGNTGALAAFYAPNGNSPKYNTIRDYLARTATDTSKYYWQRKWGSARYNVGLQFVAALYDKQQNVTTYDNWITYQMSTILGNNVLNKSLVIGYGNNYPQNPHHRAASNGVNTNNATGKHLLLGALVGGPDEDNFASYKDDVNNYITNEVACDYNAAIPFVACYLYKLHKDSSQKIDSNYYSDDNSSSGSGSNGGSSGSGSSGGNGGGTTTIDGLLPITNVASKQGTSGEWIAFGDSITYGFGVGGNEQAYPARVARVSSLRVNNCGESGRVVAIGASGATVPNERSFCNYYTSLPSSCAMITVFGGVNDFLLGVPLGSSSSTDKSTFYGALNVLADGLKSRYSSSRIVFFTPIRIGGHGNTNSAGHTLKDYRNAIVQVCNNKCIEVLDLYSLNSMDADISVSNYMGTWDTTHPNGNGHQAIADYIVSQMLN